MTHENSFYGPLADPAADAGYLEHPPRVGFFTDTSVCIGCKACEVACKEWNAVPEDGLNLLGMSFDNTGMLGADSWRHVAFIEQDRPLGAHDAGLAGLPTGPGVSEAAAEVVAEALRQAPRGGGDLGTAPVDLGFPSFQLPGLAPGEHHRTDFRWLMSSDVCKHCTHAGCLDVCPTGALFRTEFGTVVVQEDICNGCGYCVSGCPYGVIDRRHGDGRASKCTLCYDRLRGGLEPACAKACPTKSIQFGPLDELRNARPSDWTSCTTRALPRPGCTATIRTTVLAATGRSSCCWTNPRCTACRRIQWCPPVTWRRRGNTRV
jgi:formate dehydrogenase iron-sulfur subunit